eukprot:11190198-Lingulodinium_polyedra.AAC.1
MSGPKPRPRASIPTWGKGPAEIQVPRGFQGNRVVGQHYDAAIFQDFGSSPAALEVSRVADAYVAAPGHASEVAD